MKKVLFFTTLLIFFNNSYGDELSEIKQRLELNGTNEEICKNILDTLRENDTALVKPFYEASTEKFLKDPEIVPGCDNASFIEYSTVLGNTRYLNSLKEILAEKDSEYKLSWYRPLNIRFYKGDVNLDNKEDIVIYHSCMHKNSLTPNCDASFSDFFIVDTNKCKLVKTMQVLDIESEFNKKAYVGLIKYKDASYIYDGKYWEKEDIYDLTVYSRKPKINRKDYFYGHICRSQTNPSEKH